MFGLLIGFLLILKKTPNNSYTLPASEVAVRIIAIRFQ